MGLTAVLGGGGASSAVGQTGGVEGRSGGITVSRVLVLAVYSTELFHYFSPWRPLLSIVSGGVF